MKIECRPIGIVRSPPETTTGKPIQPSRAHSIEGVDLLDGTPVLDLKPYVGDFDDQTEVRCGWLDDVRGRETAADDRFEK